MTMRLDDDQVTDQAARRRALARLRTRRDALERAYEAERAAFVECLAAGWSPSALARELGVSRQAVTEVRNRLRAEGEPV